MSQSPQQQSNIFNVHSLGAISLSSETTMEPAMLQKSLLDLYCKQLTGKKSLKLPPTRLTLTPHGIIVAITKGKDEYFALMDIFSCSALVFTGSKIKTNEKKSYTYLFENIKPTQQQSLDQSLLQPVIQWNLLKKQKYLLHLKHPPLIACLIRRKQRPVEIHVFVCESTEKALSFSYSVDMARRMEIEQPSPLKDNYQDASPFRQPPQQQNIPASQAELELPEIIRKLEMLGGGTGTVVTPVIKTTNVNLINDQEFYAHPKNNYSSNYNSAKDNRKSQVYYMDQKDFAAASEKQYFGQQLQKSASNQQLNNLSVYPSHSSQDLLQHKEVSYYNFKDKKRNVQPPNQLSFFTDNQPIEYVSQKYSHLARRNSQNVSELQAKPPSSKPAQRSTTFAAHDPMDTESTLTSYDMDHVMMAGEGKLKPVAKVQPHKVTGVKVFPDGHDKTFLLPDRDKLRKVGYSGEKGELNDNKNLSNYNKNSPGNNFNKTNNSSNNYNNKNGSTVALRPQTVRSSPFPAVTPKNKNHLVVNFNQNDINNNKNNSGNNVYNNRNIENNNINIENNNINSENNIRKNENYNKTSNNDDRVKMDKTESKLMKDIWWSGDFHKN